MASAIHHGPPGSYKSFTVVQRFAIDALRQGRVVITNIRGFDSLDRIKDAFDFVLPPEASLVFIDTGTQTARDYFACWYKWIPFRALLIIDEAQTIYPDRTDFKLEHLDKIQIPEDFYCIEEMVEPRPVDVFTAFDKQRHYQWDIYLTTTNIAKIKRDIRESSEWAYRHRSLSEISRFFKGQWMEHQHDPETSGKSDSHRVGKPKKYKADPRVFNCYQSTATGEHTASNAGTKLFDDGSIKIKLMAIPIALLVAVALIFYKSSITDSKAASIPSTPVSVNAGDSGARDFKDIDAINNPLSSVKIDSRPDSHISKRWRVSGYLHNPRTKKLIFIISDLKNHTRVLMSGCSADAYKQSTCIVDGEVITSFSGSYLQDTDSKQPKLAKAD